MGLRSSDSIVRQRITNGIKLERLLSVWVSAGALSARTISVDERNRIGSNQGLGILRWDFGDFRGTLGTKIPIRD